MQDKLEEAPASVQLDGLRRSEKVQCRSIELVTRAHVCPAAGAGAAVSPQHGGRDTHRP